MNRVCRVEIASSPETSRPQPRRRRSRAGENVKEDRQRQRASSWPTLRRSA